MAALGTGSLVVLVMVVLLNFPQGHVEGKPQEKFKRNKENNISRIIDHSSWYPYNREPPKAKPGDFPWQILVLIRMPNDEGGEVIANCGGSIIYLDWIMTAAHCVAVLKFADIKKKIADGYTITATQISLYAGITKKSDRRKRNVQKRHILQKEIVTEGKDRMLFIHEDFNKVIENDNDIAIIKLKEGLKPNEYVKPIELATEFDYDTKNTLTASGWGLMEFDGLDFPDELRYANEMKLLEEKQCAAECWDAVGNTAHFTKNMICHGKVYKVPSRGDSGGAVTTQIGDSDPPEYIQLGVVSWGYGGRWIEFSTKVSEYRTWIKEITGVEHVCNAKEECNPFDETIGQCPAGPDPITPNPDTRSDNMMKCENGECFNGRCACYPGYTGPSCTVRETSQRWSVVRPACIWYYNNRDTVASTIDNCKILCEKETNFLCRSIDYVPSSGRCVLTIKDSSSGAYKQPCPNGYQDTLFTEIIFDGYTVFNDIHRNWQQAKDKCAFHGLWMAEPLEDEAVYLRRYILGKYGEGAWLNARGDGSQIRWFSSGQAIEGSNSMWEPGNYDGRVSNTYCVMLLAWTSNWQKYPNQPLASLDCSTGAITLCESQRWSVERHACIWYYNTRDTVASTIDNCKILCEKETTFLCRSIDYVPSSGRCVLTIKDSSSGAYKQPCPNGYQDTLFTEILFENLDRYTVFNDIHRNWQQAKDKCASHGLWMADPLEDEAVYLRRYILEKYGEGAWLNDHGACIMLLAWTSNWQNYPNQPLASWDCSTGAITLCEMPN